METTSECLKIFKTYILIAVNQIMRLIEYMKVIDLFEVGGRQDVYICLFKFDLQHTDLCTLLF